MNQSKLPTVIASSVIRSTHQGDSHGGVYLVDLQTGRFKQVIDWDDPGITWQGRGMDRGLRGIAIHDEHVYIAASDEIFVYDRRFNKVRSFKNRCMRHCHEIHIHDGMLYITSTGYDSILEYDLSAQQFVRGWCVRYPGVETLLRFVHGETACKWIRRALRPVTCCLLRLRPFDPREDGGPRPGDTLHINNAFVDQDRIHFAGTNLSHLWTIGEGKLSRFAKLPCKTHNARPFEGGILFNDTAGDRVVVRKSPASDAPSMSLVVKQYDPAELLHDDLPKDHARQGFGRGLCLLGNGLLAAGSSPATICVYDLKTGRIVKAINLTMDVRNAIHGLEVWPFDSP